MVPISLDPNHSKPQYHMMSVRLPKKKRSTAELITLCKNEPPEKLMFLTKSASTDPQSRYIQKCINIRQARSKYSHTLEEIAALSDNATLQNLTDMLRMTSLQELLGETILGSSETIYHILFRKFPSQYFWGFHDTLIMKLQENGHHPDKQAGEKENIIMRLLAKQNSLGYTPLQTFLQSTPRGLASECKKIFHYLITRSPALYPIKKAFYNEISEEYRELVHTHYRSHSPAGIHFLK
jgi:hypothetical protein